MEKEKYGYIIPVWENSKYSWEKFKLIQTIIKTRDWQSYRETIEWTVNEVYNEIKDRLNDGYEIMIVSQVEIPVMQNNPLEKLIELLNEYWKERWYWDDDLWMCISWDDNHENRAYIDMYIISKKYWFIKRLVDNNKIDLDRVWYVDSWDWHYYEEYENVLMRLATEDNPIEYLLSIIKD